MKSYDPLVLRYAKEALALYRHHRIVSFEELTVPEEMDFMAAVKCAISKAIKAARRAPPKPRSKRGKMKQLPLFEDNGAKEKTQ